MLVLTADQDDEMANVLAITIDQVNPEVSIESFQTGEDIVKAFQNAVATKTEVMLIILAYRLGDKTGPETAKKLRKKGYEGFIIALSGGCKDNWQNMLRDNKFRFIHKADPGRRELKLTLAVHTAATF